MSAEQNEKDLKQTEQLYEFLQGHDPEGFKIARHLMPKLTADQAWTVIWYLGNQYWQVTDHVERCGVCGNLYNSWNSGDCLDYGRAPHFFCDSCMNGEAYRRKSRSRLNPNRQPSTKRQVMTDA